MTRLAVLILVKFTMVSDDTSREQNDEIASDDISKGKK